VTDEYLGAPVDQRSADALAKQGLRLTLVGDDPESFENWIQVVARGFLDAERTPEQVQGSRERSGYRRKTIVLDAEAPDPDRPVATIASWPAELTLPGGTAVPAGAISSVTVAPTHRRRGIARAMMEGECRFLAGRGIPIAVLTVSESTLYGRYGFAPAVSVAELTIDTRRAGWIGPRPEGRIDFVSRERFRGIAPEIHDRVRLAVPGELDVPAPHWDMFAGTHADAKDPGKIRAIQYRDATGDVRGAALYTVQENSDDFARSSVDVKYLVAETDDASAALWRFLLELDLIAEVRAHEQPVDTPLLWMIADQRAVKAELRDHHYLRILDVPRILAARSYAAPGEFRLAVADPLGITSGEYVLRVDASGTAEVTQDGDVAGAIEVELGIADLSAIILGGVSPAVLAAAGRVRASDVAALSRTFGWHRAPHLSFWY